MEHRLFIAGFGGQGVMVCGQMLAYTAAETTDLNVTYFPAYGVEQRGGTANCSVIISDGRIGEPKCEKYDYMIIMNNSSMEKFGGHITPEGLLLINSNVVSVVPAHEKAWTISVPANDIAAEAGNEKAANLVMAGVFAGYTDLMPGKNIIATIHSKLGRKRPEMNAVNEHAFSEGYKIGDAARRSK